MSGRCRVRGSILVPVLVELCAFVSAVFLGASIGFFRCTNRFFSAKNMGGLGV